MCGEQDPNFELSLFNNIVYCPACFSPLKVPKAYSKNRFKCGKGMKKKKKVFLITTTTGNCYQQLKLPEDFKYQLSAQEKAQEEKEQSARLAKDEAIVDETPIPDLKGIIFVFDKSVKNWKKMNFHLNGDNFTLVLTDFNEKKEEEDKSNNNNAFSSLMKRFSNLGDGTSRHAIIQIS